MSEPRYVYDGNIDKLALAVEKLNRRAAKLGVPAIQLHIGERETCFTCAGVKGPTVSTDPKAWGDEAKPQGHERATVILKGEPPKLGGWTFAAVVDHLSNGTITRYPLADHTDVDLTKYRGADATCDHCQTNRKRHETFIVVHDPSGDEKRVGRNCLADFLGHHNPATLIGHINLWGRAFALIEGAEEAGFDTGVTMLHLPTFLSFVACQMREHGWLSRGAAFEQHRSDATADIAAHAYWTPKTSPIFPTTDDGVRGQKALDWARALTEAEIGDNDYLYNLHAVCTDDYIRPKRGGLAASVIVAAERAFEKAAEKAREATNSNLHIGAVKERLTLELTLRATREIEGYYGCSTLHKFEDAAGNLFVWFASNPEIITTTLTDQFGTAGDKRPIAVGETHTLAGTVKGHDDYKGRNQTKLTRVSVPKKKATK